MVFCTFISRVARTITNVILHIYFKGSSYLISLADASSLSQLDDYPRTYE